MSLFDFDMQCSGGGATLLCGVDEAGRGPLAGPVFAAAVILPVDFQPEGINDSKKLSEKRREALYELITANCTWAIASASVEEIELLNILGASLLAMQRAVAGLATTPEIALIDGNCLPALDIPAEAVIGGDAKSACIAAASILAKVARDRHLVELDGIYPEYGFKKHKGYPTKLHYEMLDTYGPSDVHRLSFLKKWRASRNGA